MMAEQALHAAPLDDGERLARLRLARTPRIGPVTFRQLIAEFGTAAAAIDALPAFAARAGGRRLKVHGDAAARREIAATEAFGARMVAWGDADYPAPLAAIEDAPPVFALSGRVELLHARCIGMVGARNASLPGRRFAAQLAEELGAQGFAVASGLAAGIDTAAHQGALESGTIGVIAGGIDHVYPADNRKLYDAMRERGAILAENPIGSKPTARHFPKRNRIISGLSEGVVVVEAALRSGSLITARLAGEQGREVFAVPGAPGDPRARGTNNLIRQGAVLTESAADVLRELPAQPGFALEAPAAVPPAPPDCPSADSGEMDETRRAVLDALSSTAVGIDALIRDCGAPAQAVRVALLQLELAGRIDRHPGHRVSRNFTLESEEADNSRANMLSGE